MTIEENHQAFEELEISAREDSLDLLASNTAITFAHSNEGHHSSARTKFLLTLLSLALLVQFTTSSCRAKETSSIETTATPTATLEMVVPTSTIEPSPTPTRLPPTETPLPTEQAPKVWETTFEASNGEVTLPEAIDFQAALTDAMQFGLSWNDPYSGDKATEADKELVFQQILKITDNIAKQGPVVVKVFCPGTTDFIKVTVAKGFEDGGSFLLFFSAKPNEKTGRTYNPYFVDQDQEEILKIISSAKPKEETGTAYNPYSVDQDQEGTSQQYELECPVFN